MITHYWKEDFEEPEQIGVLMYTGDAGIQLPAIFCFTGKSPKPRSEMEALAIKAGASVTKSITNETTILVIADPNSTSSKAIKARRERLDLISPEDFFEICNDTINLYGKYQKIINADAVEKVKSEHKTRRQKRRSISTPIVEKKKHSFTRRIEL